MDTAAYLTNQGWRGRGHALHHSGRGITKPIYISQKANVLGVGKKQHDPHADQWWARAFDDTLKGLNTATNKATGKMERISVDSSAHALQIAGIGGAKCVGQGGLYSNFVRGESLSGTLKPEEKDHPEVLPLSENQRRQKRGSDDMNLIADVAKNFQRSKRERWQQKRDVTECSQLVGFDAVQQDPADVRIEHFCDKTRKRPKDPETNKQRRQRKREKKIQRALKASKSCELPDQRWPTARNDIPSSDGPEKRSTEKPHTVKDAEPVTARPCDVSPDRNRNSKREKPRRAVDA